MYLHFHSRPKELSHVERVIVVLFQIECMQSFEQIIDDCVGIVLIVVDATKVFSIGSGWDWFMKK